MKMYIAIDNTNGATIIALSPDKTRVSQIVQDYLAETGGHKTWMNIHKKDDQPPTLNVFTRRDGTGELWILEREIDE